MSTIEYVILGLIATALTFGGFTAWLAGQKNRDSMVWFFLGFLFALPAMIALGFAPAIDAKEELGAEPGLVRPGHDW